MTKAGDLETGRMGWTEASCSKPVYVKQAREL
jgi:hypothetical protein